MSDNEKLLEAARMLQEHCKESCSGGPCPFSRISENRCAGTNWCFLAGSPREWKVQKRCRWTSADKALGAGLKAYGYNSVSRAIRGSEKVLVMGRSETVMELGKSLFANLQLGEVVNLDDIIGEG